MLGMAIGDDERHERRLAFRQRPGLVDDDRVYPFEALEGLRVLDEDPGGRAPPGADHDRHRRGQPERARTRDDQHRDGVDEREGQPRRRPPEPPDDEGQQRHRDDRRHEIRGDRVGQTLNRRAAALGVADHSDDLCENSVAADPLGAHEQPAGRVDGARRHARSGVLCRRHRLAGDHRFVDRAPSLDDDAVDGNLFAGPDAADVAGCDVAERNIALLAAGDKARGLRREAEQFPDRAARPAACAQLEHLAEQHERGDHDRRVEVSRNAAVHRARWRGTGREAARRPRCRRRQSRRPWR